MKPVRRISRRSFLGRVGGASIIALAGCTTAPDDDLYDPGREAPDGRGALGRRECTDADSGRHVDRPGQGRDCRADGPRRRRRRN